MFESSHRGANEWADAYGSLGTAPTSQQTTLPLSILDSWKDNTGKPQPFKPYSRRRLEKLADSIRENGVIEPITVRPTPDGRFQIIAGHNRVAASKLAGLSTVPALIKTVTDKAARRQMIDSNMHHRPQILPSERAKSYSEMMEDIQHQGQRFDLTSDNDCPKLSDAETELTSDNDCPKLSKGLRSDQVIADMYGVSATSVKQYIHLLKLHPAMLDMIDNDAQSKEDRDNTILCMSFVAGYELSFLEEQIQDIVLSAVCTTGKAPTPAQAKQLRKTAAECELDENAVLEILQPAKKPKASTIKLPANRIGSFFPPNTSPDIMEAEIYEALLMYRRQNHSPASV